MSRLAGQVAFVIGFLGFLFQILALSLKNWQTANGGSSMGLWAICTSAGCRPLTRNGQTEAQWASLWLSRALLIAALLLTFVALWRCGIVMQQKGTRSNVKQGIYCFILSSAVTFVSVVTYMTKQKLPDEGQKWAGGVGLLITTIGVLFPLAAFILRFALFSKRYDDPDKPVQPLSLMNTYKSSQVIQVQVTVPPPPGTGGDVIVDVPDTPNSTDGLVMGRDDSAARQSAGFRKYGRVTSGVPLSAIIGDENGWLVSRARSYSPLNPLVPPHRSVTPGGPGISITQPGDNVNGRDSPPSRTRSRTESPSTMIPRGLSSIHMKVTPLPLSPSSKQTAGESSPVVKQVMLNPPAIEDTLELTHAV